MSGLYIHIPFCVRRCLYCGFYTLALGKGPLSRRKRDHHQLDHADFIDALAIEFSRLPQDFKPKTIYIGGGTPSELCQSDFERLFREIREHVDLSQLREWTCEANPGTLTPAKADAMCAGGVTRFSLGVQSFDPANLKFLTRIHSAEEAIAGVQLLRERGVKNLNLDLIFAIPGSHPEILRRDLEQLLALEPEHSSIYCLEFDKDSPLLRMRDKGLVKEVDGDEAEAQYRQICDRLSAAGYSLYELFNFAKPGFESQHNLNYWAGGEYFGCGPSAHSHVEGQRFHNIPNLTRYMEQLAEGRAATQGHERLDPEARARERLMLGLRRTAGIDPQAFALETGYAPDELAGETLGRFIQTGWMEQSPNRLKLRPEAYFISDGLFSELI